MLSRLRNVVIFEYATKADQTLYRHHAVWRAFLRVWQVSTLTGAALLAEAMFSWFLGVSTPAIVELAMPFVIVGLFGIGCVMTGPAALGHCLVKEIEEALSQRGLPVPKRRVRDIDIGITAMKLVAYFGCMVLLAHLMRRAG